ncbi:MAG: hypothetical protein KJZ93_19210 [Caldilineaceae bacterium]|nr:hypothetical protein [Caldilineaceae bacterium]
MDNIAVRPTIRGARTPIKTNPMVGGKLAEVCRNLRPFQSLEFDPKRGVVTIITELIIPSTDLAQISDILAQSTLNEKLVIHRYADMYKLSFTRYIQV